MPTCPRCQNMALDGTRNCPSCGELLIKLERDAAAERQEIMKGVAIYAILAVILILFISVISVTANMSGYFIIGGLLMILISYRLAMSTPVADAGDMRTLHGRMKLVRKTRMDAYTILNLPMLMGLTGVLFVLSGFFGDYIAGIFGY